MKVKNIRLVIKDAKEALKEFATSLSQARKRKSIAPHEELSFQSIDVLRKVLTEKRMELLHTVKKHSPESIYELAKMLNRDLKSVNTDVAILADLGLISLETLKEARKKTKPIVAFSKLNVEIAI